MLSLQADWSKNEQPDFLPFYLKHDHSFQTIQRNSSCPYLYQGFFVLILKLTSDGIEHATAELRERIAELLQLSTEDLNRKLPSGNRTVLANRIAWATVYLTKAGALLRVKRGVYQIAERGRELLRKHADQITVDTLSQFPEFTAFHKNGGAKDTFEQEELDPAQTPDEKMIAADALLVAPSLTMFSKLFGSVRRSSSRGL